MTKRHLGNRIPSQPHDQIDLLLDRFFVWQYLPHKQQGEQNRYSHGRIQSHHQVKHLSLSHKYGQTQPQLP